MPPPGLRRISAPGPRRSRCGRCPWPGMVIDLAVPAAPSRIPVLGSGVITEVGEPGYTRVLASEARKNHLPVARSNPMTWAQSCRPARRFTRATGNVVAGASAAAVAGIADKTTGAPEQGSACEHCGSMMRGMSPLREAVRDSGRQLANLTPMQTFSGRLLRSPGHRGDHVSGMRDDRSGGAPIGLTKVGELIVFATVRSALAVTVHADVSSSSHNARLSAVTCAFVQVRTFLPPNRGFRCFVTGSRFVAVRQFWRIAAVDPDCGLVPVWVWRVVSRPAADRGTFQLLGAGPSALSGQGRWWCSDPCL